MNRKYIIFELVELVVAYNDRNLPTCATIDYNGFNEGVVIHIWTRDEVKILKTERLYFAEGIKILAESLHDDLENCKNLLK